MIVANIIGDIIIKEWEKEYGAIQVLRNAVGVGWVSAFLERSVTEVYGSKLLALRGGGWGSNSQEKSVT